MSDRVLYSSGNEAVDAIAGMNISGNMIHKNWYKNVIKENGKPYLLAIQILAEIVYWYKPSEEKDEHGNVTGYRKKFSDDLLQKSYSDFQVKYGVGRETVRKALCYLEEQGVIKREFRTLEKGELKKKTPNVMYINLIPEGVSRITEDASDITEILTNDKDILSTKNGSISPKDVGEGIPKNEETNTKNNKEITRENTTTTQFPIGAVVDEAGLIFSEFGLEKKDAIAVLVAAGNDLEKCRDVAALLREQNYPVRNPTGWLISAIKNGYKSSPCEYRSASGYGRNQFNNLMRQNYDFEELEKRLVKN